MSFDDSVYSIVSQNGRKMLLVNGYKMRFHKMLKNNVKRWSCSKKSCTSFLKTDINDKIFEKKIKS